MTDRATCETCPYFAGEKPIHEDTPIMGECRIRAAGKLKFGGGWPGTLGSDWCGEHPDFVVRETKESAIPGIPGPAGAVL